MPPRPRSPTMRYRPLTRVPGGKRPSSGMELSKNRETDDLLDVAPLAFEPLEAGAGFSIATVATVPVATPIGEPHEGHAWLESTSSELQVTQRCIGFDRLCLFVGQLSRADRSPECV